jgi:hypothetical protein
MADKVFNRVGVMLAAAVMASLILCPATASAQAPVFKIDHFWCYITADQPVDETVLLQDQFDRQFVPPVRETVLVWSAVRLCNPVRKIVGTQVTEIKNPDNHLKLYRMFDLGPTVAPTRKVQILNQFGKKTIRVFHQEVLGVPTQKLPHAEPQDLDHFKCYRAYGGNVKKVVTLADQFQTQQGLQVTYPFGFCNPTEKIHAGATTPVTNPDDHLVCYMVARRAFSRAGVVTRNQFGQETLALREPDLLCVPSKKLKVSIVS